jgi:ADP-heptose:LPS heptosyltransferase
MLAAIKKFLASKTILRPIYLMLRWLKRSKQGLTNAAKPHLEPLSFIFRSVLPVLIVTRHRPVLLSRYMALGDVICTFPAALQLKKRHPGATFIFHCRQDYACLPRMGGITNHTISTLDLHYIETKYSFLFAGIYKFTYSDEYENTASTESVIEEYCRQHGVAISDTHPQLHVTSEILSKARLVLDDIGLDKGSPIIAIHPGPSGPFREWNNESWIGLVQALKNSGFNNIIQLGASRPDDMGAALRARIPGVIPLINRFSLEESIALISLCDVLIGIDSGLLHIAASVGTPIVGIFGSTSPRFRFSASTARLFVVSRVECQGCHHRVPRLHWITGCPFDFACMKSIQVDEVLQACLSSMPSVPAISLTK